MDEKKRQRLVVAKPRKKIKDMTDAELDAFVDQILDRMGKLDPAPEAAPPADR